MARSNVIQTNFTAGEVSPRLLARIDIEKYRNAAAEIENGICMVHGGVTRRPGMRRIASTKDPATANDIALVPFIVSNSTAYQLEFGNNYFRVFKCGAKAQVLNVGVPVEIVTPYTTAQLRQITYAQRGRQMALFHPAVAPRLLTWTSDTVWKIVEIPYDNPPTLEVDETPNTSLSLTGVGPGGIAVTAAAACFINADIGRKIISGNGSMTITGFTSTTIVSCLVVDVMPSTSLAAGAWAMTDSPKTTCTPSATGPTGAAITLTAGLAAWKNNAAFTHQGTYVAINGGMVRLTTFSTTTVMNGVIVSPLNSSLAAGVDGWTVEQSLVTGAVGGTFGYPTAGTFWQQRLIMGGCEDFPQQFFASKTGLYYDFARGAADSDGFSFSVDSKISTPIRHLGGRKRLEIFTEAAEFTGRGSTDKTLSSTNPNIDFETGYGVADVPPVLVGSETMFWTRSGRKLRSFSYSVDGDSYRANDQTVLAEHITGDGVTSSGYAAEADSLIVATREDGVLIACTLEREQNVVAWTRQPTQGLVDWVSTGPGGVLDEVWMVTSRFVAGAWVRSVEVWDPDTKTDFCVTGSNFVGGVVSAAWAAGVMTITRVAHGFVSGQKIKHRGFSGGLDGIHTITVLGVDQYTFPLASDPGPILALGDIAAPSTVWGGVAYLNTLSSTILADGVPQPSQVIASGTVTLARPAYEVEFGLPFVPRIKMLPVEQLTQLGTAQGSRIAVSHIMVRMFETAGVTINGVPQGLRNFGPSVLDLPISPKTEDIDGSQLGWEKNKGGEIEITQPLPLDWTVLGVVRKVSVND